MSDWRDFYNTINEQSCYKEKYKDQEIIVRPLEWDDDFVILRKKWLTGYIVTSSIDVHTKVKNSDILDVTYIDEKIIGIDTNHIYNDWWTVEDVVENLKEAIDEVLE